ncbi:MAG: agmatinase [Synergistales bacterium]|nr:agmatinase [Synergistales bacterium]
MTRFMGSSRTPSREDWVLFGAPLDATVSRQPGTRNGPREIRNESWHLEEFSCSLRKSLDEVAFADIGDLHFPIGELTTSLATIESVAARILSRGKRPVVLGGEHLVSWAVLAAVTAVYPDVRVLHIDAHADLRESLHGGVMSHGTVMRQVAANLLQHSSSLTQTGIRSATKEEYQWASDHTGFYPGSTPGVLAELAPALLGRPLYITLDIDVFDPACAPGTGTPEPGGWMSGDFFQALPALQSLNVVGFDLVEVSPLLDCNNITSLLAAKIVRELLLLLS